MVRNHLIRKDKNRSRRKLSFLHLPARIDEQLFPNKTSNISSDILFSNLISVSIASTVNKLFKTYAWVRHDCAICTNASIHRTIPKSKKPSATYGKAFPESISVRDDIYIVVCVWSLWYMTISSTKCNETSSTECFALCDKNRWNGSEHVPNQ